MTPEQEERLQVIEKRANAATEGPWMLKIDVPEHIFSPEVIQDLGDDCVGIPICDFGAEPTRDDIRFMVAARSDIPWLIQRLREAEEMNDDWEYARERCTETCGGPRPTGGDK